MGDAELAREFLARAFFHDWARGRVPLVHQDRQIRFELD
jgi:hypothetical protein